MSHMFLFSFAASDSFLSSLGHCESCCRACLWSWGCCRVFSMICWLLKYSGSLPYDIICVILWFQGTLTVMLISPWPLTSHQWHTGVLYTNIALLFLVCRVLDNGVFGFSLEILPCTLTFRFTDNRANEAHFQRLLSIDQLFTCWCFHPDHVIYARFFFFFFLVCHRWPFSKGSRH